jgi:Ca2+/H+ antiporter, TMEM165/GDT1 family
MTDWIHAGPTVLAAFLASFVEFVEAFTIVLAVGTFRGWRSALTGTLAAVGVLVVLVLAGGPALERLPLSALRFSIGLLLLLFGMRWLRKATLRAGGVIALHDESAVFASESLLLREPGNIIPTLDPAGVLTAFNGVLLEGLEVVFIVIAAGAVGHTLLPAVFGASLAGIIVIILGIMFRAPLTLVPENTLKLTVGVLLSAFGTFWIGEALSYPWPGGDLSVIGLIGAFLGSAIVAITVTRGARSSRRLPPSTPTLS